MRRVILVAALAASAAVLAAQTAAPRNTMEVTLVATGKGNALVEDLKQEDITIKDNGKKQNIISFEKITPDNPIEPGKPAIHNFVLIDVLNSTYRDLPENRLEFLKTLAAMGKDKNVVVLMLRGKLSVAHVPESEGPGLLRKLASQGTKGLEGSAPDLKPYDWVFTDELGLYQLFTPAGIFDRQRIEISMGALRTIAENLGGRRGRKNLYWISQGFPLLMGGPAGYGAALMDTVGSGGSATGTSSGASRGGATRSGSGGEDLKAFAKDMDFVTRVITNANVSIYPVDSRFLALNDTSISDKSMMEDIAKATGGRAFTSRRDISAALAEAMDDSKVCYSVRYEISDLKADGKQHAIKVDTSRKDVKLRYRGEYSAPMPR